MKQVKPASWAKSTPLFLLLVVIPLIRSSNLLDNGLIIRFSGCVVIGILLVLVSIIGKKPQGKFPHSPIFWIYVLLMGYSGLNLLIIEPYSDSIFSWTKMMLYAIIFFLVLRNYSFKNLKTEIPLWLSVLGGILALMGFIQLILLLPSGKLSIPLDTYQIKAIYSHRNMYAQILFLTLPFQIFRVFHTRSGLLSKLHISLSILTIFLLIILSNRTVWISLIVASIFIFSVAFATRNKNTYGGIILRRRMKNLIWGMVVSIFTSIIFLTFYTDSGEARQHLSRMVNVDTGSGKDRIELWKRTIHMIEEKPFFGCGTARWKINVLKYGNNGLVSEDNITFYQRPHNDFLWLSSELGIAGGLLYLILFIVVFLTLFRQFKKQNSYSNQALLLSVLFAVIGYTIFSFFSFPHERIVQNIILVMLFTLVILISKPAKQTCYPFNTRTKWVMDLSMLLLFILMGIFGLKRYHSEALTHQALTAKAKNKSKKVIDLINQAENPMYTMDPLSTPLSWYAGLEWYHLGNMDSAISRLNRAYQLNPYHVHVINDLASAFAKKGETQSAIQLYHRALHIYPHFEESRLNLCAVYFNSNQIDSAYATLKKVDAKTNSLLFKPFLMAVLTEKMEIFLKKKNQHHLTNLLPNDPEWYYEHYLIHLSNQIPIEFLIFDSLKQ